MKSKVIILLVAVLCFAACESNDKFLNEDPRGRLFTDNFMNNAAELDLMIVGLHRDWRDLYDRNYETFDVKCVSSDDIIGTGGERALFNDVEINLPTTSRVDSEHRGGWERSFKVINQANAIINGHRNAEGTMTEEQLNEYAAQAHFARAFTYFWLVRFFNNIPIVTSAFTPDANKEMTVSPAREVYDLIIEDLEFAEVWLPIRWTGPKLKGGAFTRGAAKTTLANVYLQMAGFPINGGTTYYALARDKAKEIIDNEALYGYGLYDHFWQLWEPDWSAYEKPVEEAIMWYAQAPGNRGVRSHNPSRPSHSLVGGWETIIAELGFFNRFPDGERKEFTFVTDFYFGEPRNAQTPTTIHYFHYTDQDDQGRYIINDGHPSYRKWWACNEYDGDWSWPNRNDPNSMWLTKMNASADWQNSRDIIMVRYPVVLLTYAEAKARTDGPDQLAYDCLNRVRNRAFAGVGSTEATVQGLSTEEFIDLVVDERGWEHGGYEFSSRWHDLTRLQLVEKATTDVADGGWRDEPLEKFKLNRPYTKRDYFLQIPSREVGLNPNLANNNPEFN